MGKRTGVTEISDLSLLRYYREVTPELKWNSEFNYPNYFL